MKIALIGYYGANNIGDDIMLLALIENLVRLRPDIKINILLVANCQNNDLAFLKPFSYNIHYYKRNAISHISNLRIILHAIKDCESVFWGGGTCFTDEDGLGIKVLLLAKLFGKKVGYIGIGIGNLKRVKNILITMLALKLANVVVFRDKYSFMKAQSILKQKNYYLTEDLVYLLYKTIENYKSNAPKNQICISWRNLDNYLPTDSARLVNTLIVFISFLYKTNPQSRFILLPFDDSDIPIHQEIYDKVKNEIPNLDIELTAQNTAMEAKIQIIGNSKFFLSVRLHGFILGNMLGIPTMGFEYSPKISYFAKSISIDTFIDWQNIYNVDVYKYIYKKAFFSNNTIHQVLQNKIESSQQNISIIEGFL